MRKSLKDSVYISPEKFFHGQNLTRIPVLFTRELRNRASFEQKNVHKKIKVF